jgi:methyl-accepting chemotaxis protein
MRTKIIAVNSFIVAIICILAFVVVRQTLNGQLNNPTARSARAQQDATTAAARLQLEALQVERWLAARAQEPATLEVLGRSTAEARGDAATQLCDKLLADAKRMGTAPALVLMVDAQGRVVGRNGSTLSRGDDLASVYPTLKSALSSGASDSDVWVSKERSEQYIASFATIRDSSNKVGGALVLGVTLTDQLGRVSEGTSGQGMVLATLGPDGAKPAAAKATDAAKPKLEAAMGIAKDAITTGHASAADISGDGLWAAAVPLETLGDGHRAALVAAGPAVLVEGAQSVPLVILGIMVLGIVMVVGAGWMLGSYISQPIAVLEEGLLAIINGQDDKRFNLEHDDLGGLAFRIDQLLNKLMGIDEDTTDAEGRVSNSSMVPAPAFRDLEDKQVDPTTDPAYALKLANEPVDAYYARIYGEYISAKKALGEATDHITAEAFRQRISGMESEASQKHGRPVRYHVKANAREVVLLPIPL